MRHAGATAPTQTASAPRVLDPAAHVLALSRRLIRAGAVLGSTTVLACLSLLGGAGVAPASAAETNCSAAANPIVCENALPGDPRSDWQVQGVGRSDDPGLRHVDERERRPDRVLQDRHPGELLPHRHPPARLLRRRRGADDRLEHQTDGDAAPETAGLPDEFLHRADRLRQLGRVGIVDGPEHRRLRASTSRIWCATTPVGKARSRSSCATTRATPKSCCRPPTRPGRRTTTTAATASTPARSPARRANRKPTRRPTRSPTTGRSTAPSRPTTASPYLYYAEYQMIYWLEEQGYNVSYTERVRSRQPGRAAEEPQGLHLQRPRRVLVGRAARERRSRPRSWGQPGVLQRQRGVLEDPLGSEHRRLEHAVPNADDLQGDALQRARRPRRPADLDRRLARPALQPAGRRRQARKRADRAAVPRQLGHLRYYGARPVRQRCACGATRPPPS